MTHPDTLQVTVLGALQATWRGDVLTFPTRKSAALLAFLAVEDRPHTREQLASLLWGPGRLRNLRQELYLLRQLPGGDQWLQQDGDRISVMAHVDLRAAESALVNGDLGRLAAHTADELLEGMSLSAPAFSDWLECERATWDSQRDQIDADGPRRLAQLMALLAPEHIALPVLADVLRVKPAVLVAWLDELPLVDGLLSPAHQARTLRQIAPQVRKLLSDELALALTNHQTHPRLAADLWERSGNTSRAAEAWTAIAQTDATAWPRAHSLSSGAIQRGEVLVAWAASVRTRGAQKEMGDVLAKLDRLALETQAPDLLLAAEKQRFLAGILWGNLEEARRAAQTLIDIADRHGDAHQRSRARLYLAEAERLSGANERAAVLYDSVVMQPGTAELDRITALNGAGAVAAARGHPEEALRLHEEALARARSEGDRQLAARLLNSVGADHMRLGRYLQAVRSFQEAATLALIQQDRVTWALARRNSGMASLRGGKLVDTHAEISRLMLEDTPAPARTQAMLLELKGEFERACGRFEPALDVIRAAADRSRSVGDHHRASMAELSIHSIALQRDPSVDPTAFLDGLDALFATNSRYETTIFVLEAAVRVASPAVVDTLLLRYPAASLANPHHVFLHHLARLRLGHPPTEDLLHHVRSESAFVELPLAMVLLKDRDATHWQGVCDDHLVRTSGGLPKPQRSAYLALHQNYAALRT